MLSFLHGKKYGQWMKMILLASVNILQILKFMTKEPPIQITLLLIFILEQRLSMSDYSIEDKVIIVTGATKGMGLASSKRLLEMGAKVVMVYFSDTKNSQKVGVELGDYREQIFLLKADITKAEDRQRIVDETLKAFNEINVLVNNAGIPAKTGFLKENEVDFDHVLDVNLKAPVFLAKLVAEQMIKQEKGGSIINFSSVCGHRAMGGISYDAAKA